MDEKDIILQEVARIIHHFSYQPYGLSHGGNGVIGFCHLSGCQDLLKAENLQQALDMLLKKPCVLPPGIATLWIKSLETTESQRYFWRLIEILKNPRYNEFLKCVKCVVNAKGELETYQGEEISCAAAATAAEAAAHRMSRGGSRKKKTRRLRIKSTRRRNKTYRRRY